jgi:hypothetical protein
MIELMSMPLLGKGECHMAEICTILVLVILSIGVLGALISGGSNENTRRWY